jgi:hypothetical protein
MSSPPADVEEPRSTPVADVDEFVSGNLKLDDDEDPDSDTDDPIVMVEAVIVVRVSV